MRSNTDVGQQGLLTEGPKGRRDADGTEAAIVTKPLHKALGELLTLKGKADAAKDRLNDAVKAIAKQTGLMASVVNRLVKAKAGDDYEDEKRKVDQAALVFEEFAGELPEQPAAAAPANGNGKPKGDGDPLAGTDLALDPAQRIAGAPEGITGTTLAGLDAAGKDAAAKAQAKAARTAH